MAARRIVMLVLVLVLATTGGAVVGSCGNGASRSAAGAPTGDVGSGAIALTLAPGVTIASASYTITGAAGYTRTGIINVANSASLSAIVSGVPAGTGYTIAIAASASDGGSGDADAGAGTTTTCAGSATFDVAAHATTAVMIHLTCHQPSRTGSVLVSGIINVCPSIGGINANPAEAIVGNGIALSTSATDPDAGPAPLTYHWTVSSGTLDDASAASPTFTCLFPGPVTIGVAVSDGDPSAACADAASVQVTCTAAGPTVYAWVVLGSAGQAIARLVTPDTVCPPIFVDGHSQPMSLRVAAGTEALRPTASTPANSKPSEFPMTTCELPIPAGAREVIAAGRALPLPRAQPNRIVVIGDTGCRMKIGNPFQACANPAEWPLWEIASNAAAHAPDLVLHVGDYHYRENACPADIAGCQGSPWGYGWDVWEQDLFKPTASLMQAAPWVVVRGNHEECARGGQGWYRFLDPQPYDEARSCNVASNDDLANYNAPYAVPIGGDAQFIVFDSSKVGAAALDPSRPADAPIFSRYQSQLQAVASLAANPNVFSIFTNHHPLLAFTSVAGANPIGGNPALLSVMQATFPGAYFPPQIKMVFEGHNHIFEAIDFATPHPVSILAGNGGDNLDINLPDPFPLGPAASGGVEPAPGVVADRIADMSSYGFLVMDRAPGGWTVSAYRHDDTLMDTCFVDAATDKISCDTYGFLHLP